VLIIEKPIGKLGQERQTAEVIPDRTRTRQRWHPPLSGFIRNATCPRRQQNSGRSFTDR